MKHLFLVPLLMLLTNTCIAQKLYNLKEAPDSNYGYTLNRAIPIKAGDPLASIRLTREFISLLRTQTDEKFEILKRGSTMGKSYKMIDIYSLVSESGTDTIKVFFNIYKRGKLYIPKGL